MRKILSIRDDGFGQRLKVLLSVMQYAENFDLKMNFIWNEKKGNYGKFHSCEDVSEIFSKKFIQDHYYGGPVPKGSDIRKIKDIKKYDGDFFLLKHYVEIEKPSVYKIFEKIGFSEKISRAINLAKSISFDSANALHLRGGDILYGPLRGFSPIFQDKIIPLPVARDILKNSGVNKWVVFAQDENVKNQAKLPKNAIFSSDYHDDLKSNAEKFIFDVVLMSRCVNIVAGNSGVSEVASILGGRDLRKIEDIYDARSIINLILNDETFARNGYDVNIMSQLYSTLYFYSENNLEKYNYIDKALEFDKNSRGFDFLRDIALLKCEMYEELNLRLKSIFIAAENDQAGVRRYLSSAKKYADSNYGKNLISLGEIKVEIIKKYKYIFFLICFLFACKKDFNLLDRAKNDDYDNEMNFCISIIEDCLK